MRFPGKKVTHPTIHLTALIDIVFLLLIFFLLASNFVEQQGIYIKVPATQSSDKDALPEFVIKIDADGVIYFQGVTVNQSILFNQLQKHFAETDKFYVAVQADRRVSYDQVVQIIDIAKLAGAKSILLITQPGENSAVH